MNLQIFALLLGVFITTAFFPSVFKGTFRLAISADAFNCLGFAAGVTILVYAILAMNGVAS